MLRIFSKRNRKASVTVKADQIRPFLSNMPLALIALPAAYGSGAFESRVYEAPWNILIGVGVESAYTGIIFFAARKSKRAFMATALTAMIVGVVYNSLHAADIYGLLKGLDAAGFWILSLVHGAPLSVLAFSYGLLMHHSSDTVNEAIKSLKPLEAAKPTKTINTTPKPIERPEKPLEPPIMTQEVVSLAQLLDEIKEPEYKPEDKNKEAEKILASPLSWQEKVREIHALRYFTQQDIASLVSKSRVSVGKAIKGEV